MIDEEMDVPAEIQMIPVASSNLSSVGYDQDNGELHVVFKNGGRYAYEGVPPGIYEGLVNAASPGSYLTIYVKNVFKHRKVA